MNKEERAKLFFKTISEIAGFEIKPNKEFYMAGYDIKGVYKIDEDLTLYYKTLNGYFRTYDYNIVEIFKGGCELEKIKETLLTDEEKEFLRQFKFEDLEIIVTHLNMYNKNGVLVTIINLDTVGFSFDGLKGGKKYSGKELGL